MENLFGELVEFEDKNELDKFINNITKDEALLIVEKAIEFLFLSNMFTMQESHVLYKAITKLKEK
jgi:hypothetical protein